MSTSPLLNPDPSPRPRLNETLQALPPSAIREFFDLVTGSGDIVSLGVGEPDFVTPWNIREYAIYKVEHGATTYTSNRGLLELRTAIARYLDERFELTYDPATEILPTVGVSQGIDLAMRALLNPGDEVIYFEPCYVAYHPMIAMAGGVPVCVEVRFEENFRLDFQRIEAAITPRTRMIFVNYPNNPTGATLTAEECRRMADLAARYGLILLSDEVYAELTYDQPHVAMPTQPGLRDNVVLLSGFSKAFAMTGWRLGYAAGPADIIAAMTKLFQYSMLSAPILSQHAGVEALNRWRIDVPPMIENYNQRRRLFVNGMHEAGIDCHLPEGAFYAFPSIKKFGLTSREFCLRLLKEEKVAVVPGSGFGAVGEGYVRCCYAVSIEEIEIAIAAIGRLAKRL